VKFTSRLIKFATSTCNIDGLQLSGSEDAPFLTMGVTLAVFRYAGISPSFMNTSNKIAIGSASSFNSFLNNIGGKPSGPDEEFQFSLEMPTRKKLVSKNNS